MSRIYATGSEYETFCFDCGKPLVESARFVGFNAMTGQERYSVLLVCPEWPVLNHMTFDAGCFDAKGRSSKAPLGFRMRGDS